MGYAPFLPCRSMQHIGHWPVPPWSRVFILLLIEHASLSINHKIVFLTPPLVPILRSNNDPEVLWIVARRGAHGDQVRGGGGQGSYCGYCEELFHNTGLEHTNTRAFARCLEDGYEDEETEERDTKLRKGFNLCLSLFYLNKMNVALIKSGELLARRLATVELSTRLREVSKFLENDPMTAVSFLVYLLSLNAYLA